MSGTQQMECDAEGCASTAVKRIDTVNGDTFRFCQRHYDQAAAINRRKFPGDWE